MPDNLSFDALEIINKQKITELLPFIVPSGISFVTFSDAHYLADIGKRRTVFYLRAPDFEEITKALGFKEGRYLELN